MVVKVIGIESADSRRKHRTLASLELAMSLKLKPLGISALRRRLEASDLSRSMLSQK